MNVNVLTARVINKSCAFTVAFVVVVSADKASSGAQQLALGATIITIITTTSRAATMATVAYARRKKALVII